MYVGKNLHSFNKVMKDNKSNGSTTGTNILDRERSFNSVIIKKNEKKILSPGSNEKTDNTEPGNNNNHRYERSEKSLNSLKHRESDSSKISRIERSSINSRETYSRKSVKRQLVNNENIRKDDSRMINKTLSKKIKISTNNDNVSNYSKQQSIISNQREYSINNAILSVDEIKHMNSKATSTNENNKILDDKSFNSQEISSKFYTSKNNGNEN